MGSYIIFNGAQIPVDFDVVDGQTLPTRNKKEFCWFGKKYPGLRKRKGEIRAVAVHHTAGAGSNEQIFDTLRTRKNEDGKVMNLGVHFTINSDGRVVQHGDLAFVLQHIGEANDWTVGIEVTNPARAKGDNTFGREVTEELVHGKKGKWLKFFPAQVEACKKLVNALCDILNLPKQLPVDGEGRLIRTALPPARLKVVRGVIGHFHVTTRKPDPVPHILEELLSSFTNGTIPHS